MRRFTTVSLALSILLFASNLTAQQTMTNSVPNLIRYSGTLKDAQGATLSSATPLGVTFAIYKQQEGGAPAWQETQNVTPDINGQYTVLLGNTAAKGLPGDLFSQQEERWLGVQVQGQAEQPRSLLVSVPYAFKAGEADTLGGLPASAFVKAPPSDGSDSTTQTTGAIGNPNTARSRVGIDAVLPCASAKNNYIPLFTNSAPPNIIICNSVMYQLNNNLGIGTTTPQDELEVAGGGRLRVSNPSGNYGLMFTASSGGLVATHVGSGTNIPLAFFTNLSAPRMTIDTSGNVGIGTTSPSHTLEVNAPGATAAKMALTSSGSDAAFSLINTGSGGREYWIDSGSGTAGIGKGNFAIWDATAAAARFVVNPSGNVGIGTNMPMATLDVRGNASGSAGIYGQYVSSSGLGSLLGPAGVWGDSSTGIGVYASSNTGFGLFAATNGPGTAAQIDSFSANSGDLIFEAYDPNFIGACDIDVLGDLFCTGSKSAVVPVDGGSRKVALYAVEAPQNWFEDAGSAQLANGEAVVSLEQTFAQTVNAGVDYHVFLTPNGDCKGLYVAQKSPTSFTVRELGGGTSSINFDYRIMALRKGYETLRLADKTKQVPNFPLQSRSTQVDSVAPKPR